jgi:S-phase kinase-associated protein 1
MSSEGEQAVKLISSDNVEIVTGMRPLPFLEILTAYEANSLTERKIAERSMLIKNMIEDLGAPGEEPIPIMNVSRISAPAIFMQN